MKGKAMITPTSYDKRQWSILAAEAFRRHSYSIAMLFSMVAKLPAGTAMDVRRYDELQNIYRHWLVFGELGG
jgi:hypothetical protein